MWNLLLFNFMEWWQLCVLQVLLASRRQQTCLRLAFRTWRQAVAIEKAVLVIWDGMNGSMVVMMVVVVEVMPWFCVLFEFLLYDFMTVTGIHSPGTVFFGLKWLQPKDQRTEVISKPAQCAQCTWFKQQETAMFQEALEQLILLCLGLWISHGGQMWCLGHWDSHAQQPDMFHICRVNKQSQSPESPTKGVTCLLWQIPCRTCWPACDQYMDVRCLNPYLEGIRLGSLHKGAAATEPWDWSGSGNL